MEAEDKRGATPGFAGTPRFLPKARSAGLSRKPQWLHPDAFCSCGFTDFFFEGGWGGSPKEGLPNCGQLEGSIILFMCV